MSLCVCNMGINWTQSHFAEQTQRLAIDPH